MNVFVRIIALFVICAVHLDCKPADSVVQIRIVLKYFGRYRLEYVEKILLRLCEIRVVFACRIFEKAVVLGIGEIPYNAFEPEKNKIKILLHVLGQIFKLTRMFVEDGPDDVRVVS